MPTHILGISAFYHDSAACLVRDGEVVAAAQEERFTRKKHDPDFPSEAVKFCLEQGGIDLSSIDYVGFYDKPLLKFDRLLETYLAFAPRGYASFAKAMPVWLGEKLHIPRVLTRHLGGKPKNRYVFTEHHESHAASAFFPSPFENAAVLTMDGVGEWATTSIASGEGNKLRMLKEIRFPHSLGLLYSAFTYYCGFRVNSGEYKLMGLAPYGEPRFVDRMMENLIDLKEDGSYRLNLEYFEYPVGLRMTGARMAELFGQPERKSESDLTQFHMDVAASVQKVTEEVVLRTVRYAHQLTGHDNLCLAGGVALNCVGNGRILREGPFRNVWIQPASGDAGGALGAAMFIWHHLMNKPRQVVGADTQRGSLLGPRFRNSEIRALLDREKVEYEAYEGDEAALTDRVAELIADENVIGWFQGPMEFGPRALGSRSIIGDARSPRMQSVMNLKIKFRESFRPFAPIVLREDAPEYFQIEADQESPYMLIVAPVRESIRKQVDPGKRGLEKLSQQRSTVPAVTHVDYSARVQTVDESRNPRLTALLRRFKARTGCPVLINTSFNVRGEPIVCDPANALRCFWGTEMDVLVLEDFVICRKTQKNAPKVDRKEYLSAFALD
ncbi:MAG: carbamoyltransferase [Planctomycetes bacterium]|nr:carbamoyltransferase [Planctomycetota bacterium]MCB9888130.1 carbamoyltransferase [Planctomycetota bacterium]